MKAGDHAKGESTIESSIREEAQGTRRHRVNKESKRERRGTASLVATCLVDQFAPQVGESVVSVLESAGLTVEFVEGQTCCGQPAFNSGFRDDARDVAWRFVELFESVPGDIVCPSGSCTAMVRNYYPVLFRDDRAKAARAAAVAGRVWEFTEYLVDVLGITDLGVKSDAEATYHKCCHLLRELHVESQPERLLSDVSGLEMVELTRADVCCGFGGAFSAKMPDISTAMLEEKIEYIERAGVSTVIAGDTGCIMHMQGGLRRRGSDVQVVHIAEVLAGRH